MVAVRPGFTKYAKLLQSPPEIIIHILSYLDWRQLLSAQTISRSFLELIRSSLELRYIIELGADDLVHNVDKSSRPLTTQDRLTLLLDRRRRWRTLDWTQKASIPLPGSCQAYELVGGVFAKSMRGGGTEDTWPPGSRHLIAAWLPTRDDSHIDAAETMPRVVKDDLGIWTRDFAIDPTQDILALLEVDPNSQILMHIRTLSTQEIHPLAAESPLIFPSAPTPEFQLQQQQIGSYFLQIVGDIIGIFYWHSGHCLRIWNWQTGVLLVAEDNMNLPIGCSDLAFLNPRAYMIACIGDSGTLDLYEIHDPKPSSLEVEPPTCLLRLRFPEVLPHRQLRTIYTHSSPHLANPEALRSPFVQRQDRRIHLIQLQYGELLSYTLYVKNETLLDLMDQVREGRGVANHLHTVRMPISLAHFATPGVPEALRTGRLEKSLSWKRWGPRNTRFLQQDLRFQWLRYVNGYRVVMPPAVPNAPFNNHVHGHTELCIYDFNVHPNRTDDPCDLDRDGEDTHPQWTYEVRTEETVLPERELFVEPVVSSLPYAVSRRTGVSGYTGFMIDEQRLVGMKELTFNGPSACDIDVFTL